MNAPEVVRRYAATLLEAAEETEKLDLVTSDVRGILGSIESSDELAEFLDNPLMSSEIQERVLVALFGEKVDALTINFLSLVSQRRRAGILNRVLTTFIVMVEERRGVVSAEIYSSVPLDHEQLERVKAQLSSYFGNEVSLRSEIDSTLRGGVIARVGDIVFDGSLNTHLERLRRRLVGA